MPIFRGFVVVVAVVADFVDDVEEHELKIVVTMAMIETAARRRRFDPDLG